MGVIENLVAISDGVCRSEVIGYSRSGRPLLLLTITEPSTPDTAKSGIWVDGDMHPSEVLGSTACLNLATRLVQGWNKDRRIQELLMHKVFYILPRWCVDAVDTYLTTPYYPRGNNSVAYEVVGRISLEDIDGDGIIREMRVPNPAGAWRISTLDLRLMVPRQPGDSGPFYDLFPEGRYHTHAKTEFDSFVDLNRNFPYQFVASYSSGPNPLSEPETAAVAQFIRSHPNIGLALNLHTWAGVILTPFANPEDSLTSGDQILYDYIAQVAKDTLGYPCIPGWKFSPAALGSRAGTFVDWLYQECGVLAMAVELWGPLRKAGVVSNYVDPMIPRSDQENKKFLDWLTNNIPNAVRSWQPFHHPDLGMVEIGGINRKFVLENPPPNSRLLQDEVEHFISFVLKLAEGLPLVRLVDCKMNWLGHHQIELQLTVENTGYWPTSVTKRAELILPPVTVTIRYADNIQTKWEVGNLDGYGVEHLLDWISGNGSSFRAIGRRRVSRRYRIRLPSNYRGPLEIVLSSPRAGLHRYTLHIKKC
ncbi:hypothetical protein DRO69_09105 [Candidatus Bathyarchaeota archaeon]|nr:MAG: hypothetical protein DRO69_09105 [Candidatus Bathyarchaeota archaeon]